ncbi:hypothetical protein EB796_005441 [Bugula neritina]|uniref:Uncharacterized protein n=1 Tax=Bugula neritina TaxID=10212 RepID=A0A7J7KDI2_BUGNE|nr:hypothetical protein EB796_005441 [Bugula neritina]
MTECRKRKVECEVALSEKRQLQLDKINSVYMATLLLQQNKEQVELLDQEMDELQTQLNNKENIIQSTEVEMEREQNAIDFLNHTISSTKRNQRLLVKRQHLLKTRKSLEKKLEQIKSELQTVNEELQQKTLKKVEMRKRLEQNTTSHSTITADLNSFTNSLEEIEKEAKSVHTELIDIEIIHCIKTSPENLDDMQDRPQSVKIARSLRDTIYRKRSQQPKLL